MQTPSLDTAVTPAELDAIRARHAEHLIITMRGQAVQDVGLLLKELDRVTEENRELNRLLDNEFGREHI